jgi:hypothetical protein
VPRRVSSPAGVPSSSRLALEAGGSDAIGSVQTTTTRRDTASQAASRGDPPTNKVGDSSLLSAPAARKTPALRLDGSFHFMFTAVQRAPLAATEPQPVQPLPDLLSACLCMLSASLLSRREVCGRQAPGGTPGAIDLAGGATPVPGGALGVRFRSDRVGFDHPSRSGAPQSVSPFFGREGVPARSV